MVKIYNDIISLIIPFLFENEAYILIDELDNEIFMKDLNIRIASFNGCLQIVKFLLKQDTYDDKILNQLFDLACKNGHRNIIEFLHDDYQIKGSWLALKWACKMNHFNVVKYLCSSHMGIKPTNFDLEYAVVNGNLEMLKFLTNIKNEYPSSLVYTAIVKKRLDIIKFLYSKNTNLYKYTSKYVLLACQHECTEIGEYFNSMNRILYR